MPSFRTSRLPFLATAVALFAACGGDGSRPEAAAELPQDTFIRPIEREPLTEADLAGMTMSELSVELPWTRNTLGRDPVPGAEPAPVLGAQVTAHERFDRVVFSLDDNLPPPGYQIYLAEAGATLECAGRTEELKAPRTLVVTFTSARAGTGGASPLPLRVGSTGAPRMPRAGAVCDEGGTVAWIAELAQADQLRVLELRGPSRIAVDVR